MILSCQNISKAFGTDVILKQASFHIEDHEKAAIVGINGAGKTTLLRIIVGEIRGQEAVDLLQAMNTGHDGSLSTGHSNSAADMLSRLETMVLMGMDLPVAAIRQQIASAVDIIIHLGRLKDKSRKVLEIVEVCEYCEQKIRLNTLYEYDYQTGKLEQKGALENNAKMLAADLALL